MTRRLIVEWRNPADGTVRRDVSDPGLTLKLARSTAFPKSIAVSDVLRIHVVDDDPTTSNGAHLDGAHGENTPTKETT